ncbi:MAG: hypothetical protein MI923_16320 [Phycisphaerales bacterium]|nr:hypothetical protein [Phycisphaerales bacterium]
MTEQMQNRIEHAKSLGWRFEVHKDMKSHVPPNGCRIFAPDEDGPRINTPWPTNHRVLDMAGVPKLEGKSLVGAAAESTDVQEVHDEADSED